MICPRCGSDAEQQYYGPFGRCREELRTGAAEAAAARRVAGTAGEAAEADRALQGQERAIGS